MRGMVHILRISRLRVSQSQVSQQRRQQHKQRNYGSNARVLQLADIALIELFELVVLETMWIEEAAKGARRIHRLHAVIHGDGGAV